MSAPTFRGGKFVEALRHIAPQFKPGTQFHAVIQRALARGLDGECREIYSQLTSPPSDGQTQAPSPLALAACIAKLEAKKAKRLQSQTPVTTPKPTAKVKGKKP